MATLDGFFPKLGTKRGSESLESTESTDSSQKDADSEFSQSQSDDVIPLRAGKCRKWQASWTKQFPLLCSETAKEVTVVCYAVNVIAKYCFNVCMYLYY